MSARIVCAIAVAASLSGCGTYLDARADLAAGGPQQRVAAAQSNLTAAQNTSQDLQDQQLALERDIERNEKRIAAAQSELDQTRATLADALAKKRLSEQEYAKLRKESDALNSELAKLDLQLQADRGDAGAGPEVAAKEARLRELERRKADLDRAIKAALGG